MVKIADDTGELTLRFLNFYGSQTKQMAEGVRLRVRGEIRGGFFGAEMVHPQVRPVVPGEALPDRLTPVYPATAGISQAYLRKAIGGAMSRTPMPETLPQAVLQGPLAQLKLAPLADCLRLLHNPPPQESGGRAGGPLASGLAADQVRRIAGPADFAAALAGRAA